MKSELKIDYKNSEILKEMAKTLHPDTPTGDVEKFKKLNHAHKILKRELS